MNNCPHCQQPMLLVATIGKTLRFFRCRKCDYHQTVSVIPDKDDPLYSYLTFDMLLGMRE